MGRLTTLCSLVELGNHVKATICRSLHSRYPATSSGIGPSATLDGTVVYDDFGDLEFPVPKCDNDNLHTLQKPGNIIPANNRCVDDSSSPATFSRSCFTRLSHSGGSLPTLFAYLYSPQHYSKLTACYQSHTLRPCV